MREDFSLPPGCTQSSQCPDLVVQSIETPALAAGQSATVTFRLRNWVLRPQSVLGVTADYKHMLVECFEENNTKELR